MLDAQTALYIQIGINILFLVAFAWVGIVLSKINSAQSTFLKNAKAYTDIINIEQLKMASDWFRDAAIEKANMQFSKAIHKWSEDWQEEIKNDFKTNQAFKNLLKEEWENKMNPTMQDCMTFSINVLRQIDVDKRTAIIKDNFPSAESMITHILEQLPSPNKTS